MNTSFLELVQQSYDFPQRSFSLKNDSLLFNNVELMGLVNKHGTPLKISYLPKISENIKRAKTFFNNAFKECNYNRKYIYSYCTKSSHFRFVLEEALANKVELELSSEFDIDLCYKLKDSGVIDENKVLILNGFKPPKYIEKIKYLLKDSFFNPIIVLDNKEELKSFEFCSDSIDIGIRIAAEEEPRFEFYTSRLGIRYKEIISYYLDHIQNKKQFRLKMLHFFINTGINDSAYYWSELKKVLDIYTELKKVCPELTMLNLGGGLPIQYSLSFDYDYQYMINSIVQYIKDACDEANVEYPDLVTEFGNFTVGESGATIFKVLGEKKQNDRESWYLIDGSLMTTMPDIYSINQRFVLLPLNKWNKPYKKVNIGGLSCDGMDYYNSEVNLNFINLPEYSENDTLFLGFFHTGAYQDSLSGYGGLKHCLIPSPKHIFLKKNESGVLEEFVFNEEQKSDDMLKILGF